MEMYKVTLKYMYKMKQPKLSQRRTKSDDFHYWISGVIIKP